MPIMRLGEILVRKRFLTPEAMQTALDKQATQPEGVRLPVGQILLAEGLITEAQLLEALEIQRKLAAMPEPQTPAGG